MMPNKSRWSQRRARSQACFGLRSGVAQRFRSAESTALRLLSLIFMGMLMTFAPCGCSFTNAAKREENGRQADSGYRQLLLAREVTASQLLQRERHKRNTGKTTLESVISAALRLRDARLELAAQSEVVVRAEHLSFMRELERDAESSMGLPELIDPLIELARYWRLSAEIDLVRARATTTVH